MPQWREYANRVQMRGRTRGGAHLTLVESVRQDPRRRLTTFEQRTWSAVGATSGEHRFELTFRTVPVPTDDVAGSSGPGSRSRPCSATTAGGPGTSAPTCGFILAEKV